MNTDLEIYRARASQAQARIDADRAAGRAPTKLDLYRLELNSKLIEDSQLDELIAIKA